MDMSNLINCPEDIIKEFATLATSKDAFGNPSEWTAIQVFYNNKYKIIFVKCKIICYELQTKFF